MKFAKYFFASFLLLAVTSAFVTPKSHHVTKGHKTKKSTTVNEELAWTGSTFTITTGTKTDLPTASNWQSAFQSVGTTSCGTAGGNLCKVTISYTYDLTDPAPTIQEVINTVRDNYNDPAPPAVHSFNTSPFSFTKNGVTINITVVTKS